MSISELFGLLISLVAFLFILFGQGLLRPKNLSPQEEEARKKRLKEFLKNVNADMEDEEEEEEERIVLPLPPPVVKPPSPRPVAPPAPVIIKKVHEKSVPEPAKKHSVDFRKKMVIFKEMLDKPRAYRPWNTEN